MSRTERFRQRRRMIPQLVVAVLIIAAALLQPRIESWLNESFSETNPTASSGIDNPRESGSDLLPRPRTAPGHQFEKTAHNRSVLVHAEDTRSLNETTGVPDTGPPRPQINGSRTASRESGDEPPPGSLTQVSPDIFRSTAGLIYRPGSREGHRLKHILTHSKDNLNKPLHGVFVGDREEILRWIDQAFMAVMERGRDVRKRQKDERVEWTVHMKEKIGYVGGYKGKGKACRFLRLVVEDDGETVVTAYPTSSF